VVPRRRWVSLGLLLMAALPWSAALTIVGLWALFSPPASGPLGSAWVARGVGCAALAGGQLVFFVCVSGRVFPRADRRITVPVEGLMTLAFAGGLLAASGGMLWHGGSA
jgi:hypothetical protein